MKQLLELYGDLETFLRQHDDLAPATRNKLLQHLDDPTKKAYLQLELAVTVDAGLSFVQATYKLEGDGPLALECYEVISSLTTAVTRCLTIPTYRQWQDVCLEETRKVTYPGSNGRTNCELEILYYNEILYYTGELD